MDGTLHTKFDIVSTGSYNNYTRSYYMNGRDYIISGSCEEPVVRVCCAQTGRLLRNIYLEVDLFFFQQFPNLKSSQVYFSKIHYIKLL